MHYIALLLLVAAVYAEEPDCSDEVHTKDTPGQEDKIDLQPTSQENECNAPPPNQDAECNMPDSLHRASLRHCKIEKCDNVTTIEIKEGAEQYCPGKSTCTLRMYNCPTTYAGAVNACRCYRGRLVSIHNYHFNNQVRCAASSVVGNCYWSWIGVSRNACGYRNADGSCFNYRNFALGQQRICGNWCVAMQSGNGYWYSWNCCTRLPYVCAF